MLSSVRVSSGETDRDLDGYAASEFGRNGRYRLGRETARSRFRGDDRTTSRMAPPLSHHRHRRSLAEDDEDGSSNSLPRRATSPSWVRFLVTSAERVLAAAARGACKPSLDQAQQVGTLTEAKAAFHTALAQVGALLFCAFRRDGRCHDRSPGGRLGPQCEGRIVRPL